MLRNRIIFPEINRAALIREEIPDQPGPGQVLVKTEIGRAS